MSVSRDQRKFIDGALTVRLCTVSSKGVPLITPLWFARDGECIYMGTRRDSFHAKHIARNPQVILLFSDRNGRATRRVLRATGTATLTDPAISLRRQLRMAARYYLPPRSAWHWLKHWRKWATLRRYHDERRDLATIEIHLESAEFLVQPLP